MLYARIRRLAGSEDIPEMALRFLMERYYEVGSRNARLYNQLEHTLVRLADAGIDAVVLKGAALAEPVYGDIALRPMEDLDLLLHTRDVERANAILEVRGYRPLEWYRRAAWYRMHSHHLAPLVSPDGSVVIELHRHIVPPATRVELAVDELWARVRPTQIGSTQAFVFAPEDLLFHVCTHHALSREFVGGLRTLCDIAAVIDRFGEELDWNRLVSVATAAGASQHVFFALAWAHALVGAACPETVLATLEDRLRPRVGHRILDRVGRRVMQRSPAERSLAPPWLTNAMLGELLASPSRPVAAAWRVARGYFARNGRAVNREAA